jgi:CBS domain-containing protein
MALPRIDSDPTAVERLPASRPVTPAMTITTAEARLQATGEAAAVVLEDGRPVGVVTAAALARAVTKQGPDTPIAVILDYVAVPVDPQGGAYETIRAFRRAAWDWLEHRKGWR